ncbi:MAG: response regulator transcription factor [Hylemonella sp.]|nr:response regulator transcription factor [Hylemonella sp.]
MKNSDFKVMIADDHPEQLAYLVDMVKQLRPHWNLISQATSAAQVARDLVRLQPNLSILDVCFADTTSFEIVKDLRERFATIFVTGDATYAVDAFSHDAVDFLLKPVRLDRLEQALIKGEAYALGRSGKNETPVRRISSVRMLKGHDLVWAPLSEVRFFEAQKKYTRVVLRESEGLLKMGISAVMNYLDPGQFWQIHRSIIVNAALISSARRDELGRFMVTLADRPERLAVARPYETLFKDGFS